MRTLLTLGLASVFLAVSGCQDTATTGPLGEPDFHAMGAGHGLSRFAMLDDFATETTGAGGSGSANIQENSVQVDVKAKDLLPNHEYELNITIDFASVATFGPVTSDKHGKVKFKGDLDLVALLGPGTYRLDFFVTHTTPTIPDPVFPGLLDRDLLLRCAPFVAATVVAIN
jgi:hypothetical protein